MEYIWYIYIVKSVQVNIHKPKSVICARIRLLSLLYSGPQISLIANITWLQHCSHVLSFKFMSCSICQISCRILIGFLVAARHSRSLFGLVISDSGCILSVIVFGHKSGDGKIRVVFDLGL